MLYATMSPSERRAFEMGQDIVLGQLWDALAGLEKILDGRDGSYAKGQKYILRRICEEMDIEPDIGKPLEKCSQPTSCSEPRC